MKHKTLPIAIVFVSVLTIASPIARAQKYSITDLGSLSPAAINIWGQIVGTNSGHAFMWTRFGGLRDLGILPGGTFSTAAAINDLGVVTGTADGPGTVAPEGQQCSDLTQPFVWTQKNGMQGLGTISLPEESNACDVPFYAKSINVPGEVVGYDGIYTNDWQFGFLWTSSDGMTRYGDSFPPTFANAISNTGQIVGENSDNAPFSHATAWKDGVATDLGSLGGGPNVLDYASSANGINDQGQIVGWSTTAPISNWFFGWCGTATHAVLWSARGGIRDLGTLPGDTLSAASNITFFGQIIGSSGNTATCDFGVSPYEVFGRPFIWTNRRGMQDLNTLISANSGWVLNSAVDINIWGQIIGQGTLNGQPHGFLLTPKRF